MKLVFSVLFLTAAVSYASGKVANGGDGVVCRDRDGNITSVELLDFFEAHTRLRLKIDLGSADLSEIEKATLAVTRLPSFEHERKALYLNRIRTFIDETDFISKLNLNGGPNAVPTLRSGSCKIETIAAQGNREFPEHGYYMVQKDLWDKMDSNNRAGLILHEIIYREAIELGHTDSKEARYFTALISANRLSKSPIDKYVELLERIGFPYEECHKVRYWTGNDFRHSLICFEYGSVTLRRRDSRFPVRGVLVEPKPFAVIVYNRHRTYSSETADHRIFIRGIFVGEVELSNDSEPLVTKGTLRDNLEIHREKVCSLTAPSDDDNEIETTHLQDVDLGLLVTIPAGTLIQVLDRPGGNGIKCVQPIAEVK